MAYVGAGDIKAFAAWWGLRAYRAATCGAPCADICATAGGTPTTINTLANGSFDTASALTALGGSSGFIAKLYDQTGGGHHLVQTDGSAQPEIQLNVLQSGTLPEIRMPGVAFTTAFSMSDAGTFTASSPWTAVAVVKPNAWSGQRTFLGVGNGNDGGGSQGLSYISATQVGITTFSFSGGTTVTWSSGSYHRVIGVDSTTIGALYLDGVANTFTGDTDAFATTGELGVNIGDGIGYYDISAVEFGVAASAFSSTDAAGVDANINTYWFGSSALSDSVSVTLGPLTVVATASVTPLVTTQVGMSQGFLFKPGAGPTWNLRGRAAFPAPVQGLTGNVTLGLLTSSATAAAKVQATANVTLGALTSAATAAAPNKAAVAATLGAVTAAAVVADPEAATASITLGTLTAVATASGSGGATVSATLGPLTSNATATDPCSASVAVTLGAVTSAAAITDPEAAVAANTLGALTLAATATVRDQASASITLGALTAAATVSDTPGMAAAITLGSLTASATATVLNTLTASATLGSLSSSATAAAPTSASANVTLGALLANATTTDPEAIIVPGTLGLLMASATAANPAAAQVSVTLGALVAAATAKHPGTNRARAAVLLF